MHEQRDSCWGELASRDTNEELEEPQEIQCYKAETAIKPQIKTNVDNFLLVFLFVFMIYFVHKRSLANNFCHAEQILPVT